MKRGVIIDAAEHLKWYKKKLFPDKLKNLKEMNKFLEKYYLMSFTQRETENLNNFKTIKDSKKIKTSMRKM